MKQMNLLTFLSNLTSKKQPEEEKQEQTEKSKNNNNDSEDEGNNIQFIKSTSSSSSKQEKENNKENFEEEEDQRYPFRTPKNKKALKRIKRVNTIEHCFDNSKDDNEDDNDDSELEIINVLADGLNKERKERSIMEAHGFNSNAAVCLPSWKDSNQLSIELLEADEVAFSVCGDYYMEYKYGGNQYSGCVGQLSKRKSNRSISCLISSDDETDENDEDFLKPQTEDNQWIVEKVLARRVVMEGTKKRTVQYFLKWKGWEYKYSTWEVHCKENSIQDLLKNFDKREIWRESICRRVPSNERIYFYNSYMLSSHVNCHQWEDEMNNLIKSLNIKQAPIYVENWVDEESKPKKFQYILENRFSKETENALKGIPNIEHCKCNSENEKCGSRPDCCPYNFNQIYCYTDDGRIDTKQNSKNKYWIVECTDACKCDINCPSRVVQRGRQIPIVIFRTLDRGWAVRTCVDIKKKTFVCEYVGEVLTDEESLESKKPSTYQFQMDGCGPKYFFIVDAANYGNEARFVNHSCGPNLAVYPVFADRLDERYHRIAFFAKRDIKQGDELTIDYCAIDQFAKGRRQKQCNCKSKKCRGYFYY